MRSLPLAFELSRWVGATYLLWLGARRLNSRHRNAAEGRRWAPSTSAAVREGMAANLTDLAPLVFMLAFLPQFVAP